MTHFRDESFRDPAGPPTIDRQLHFATWDSRHPAPAWLRPHSSARWEGYIDLPRNGDYIFRLSSDDGSWLYLDDKLIVDNHGLHRMESKQFWEDLPKGVHRLRIDYVQAGGDAGLNLEFRFPAGYHTVGLMPMSLVTPDPPVPPGPLDRALRLATWLLFPLAFALFFRHRIAAYFQELRENAPRRRVFLAGVAVCLLAAGARFYNLTGAGETCDEWAYVAGGDVYARNIVSGVFDPDQWRVNREHPPLGKLLYGAAGFVFGNPPVAAHAVAATLSTLTVLITFLAGLRLFGLLPAVGAGIVLSLLPPFLAHSKVPALDAPATFFFTLIVWLLIRFLTEPERRQSLTALLVLVSGLGVATKFSAFLLVPIVFGVVVGSQWRSHWKDGHLRLHWSMVGYPMTAFLPMALLWPWLWADPFSHAQETLHHWNFTPSEMFFGTDSNPPPTYFFWWFGATIPVVLFLPFLIGVLQGVRRSPAGQGALAPRAAWLFLFVWFLFPFVWTLTGFRMGGIRYILPVYPPFALLCGLGLGAVAEALPKIRWAGLGLLGTTAGYLLFVCARIHPYYLDYFNEVAGGTRGAYASKRFATGWWGEGYDEAVAWVNKHAPSGASYDYDSIMGHLLVDFRPDLTRLKNDPEYVVQGNLNADKGFRPGYQQVFAVTAAGAPLVRVWQRKPPEQPEKPEQAISE